MYMNYKDGKKIKYILVFFPFLSLEPERKEEEKKFRDEDVYEISCTLD